MNTAWSQRRKVKRHQAESLDEITTVPASTTISPERSAESAAIRQRLVDALNELTPPVRAVVVLKDIYDWSHGDIAEHLDITVTAAKVRLHRGRKQLRDILWNDLGGEV